MLADFSVVPLGRETGLSEYVAQMLQLVQKSGLNYSLHDMGTIVEGDFDQVMALIKDCHQLMFKDFNRIVTTIKIDDKKGASNRLGKKKLAVERVLERQGELDT